MSDGKGEQQATVAARLKEKLENDAEEGDPEVSPDAGGFADADVRDAVSWWETVDPEFRGSEREERIKYRQKTKSVNEAVKDGEVARMQHQIGWIDNTEDTNDGVARLMPYLSRDAFIGAVVAEPENGKTNATLWVADIWSLLHNGVVVTNVPVGHPPSFDPEDDDLDNDLAPDHVVLTDSEAELYDVVENLSRPSLVALDEFATAGGREGNTADELEKMVREIRKEPWRSSILLVGHGDTDITRPIRQMTQITMHKPNKTTAEVYQGFNEGFKDGEYLFDMSVPKCRLDYPEYENPQFVFDDGDEDDVEDELTEEQRREVKIKTAVRLRDNGLTQSEVAEEMGMSRTWVSRYVDPRLESDADERANA